MNTRLNTGDTAPSFTLNDQDGERVSLADFAGENVILYFYPAAMTPGCTTQACDFRDSMSSLQGAGYRVIGVSRDAPEKLGEFARRDHLDFPLLSDPDHTIHDAYGAWGEKKLYGKPVIGVLRSTVVIDGEGRVTLALYNVKASGHVASLRKKLGVA